MHAPLYAASPRSDPSIQSEDSDGDGKITKSELTDTLKQVEQQLDQQFQQMRMQGGMQAGGMRPPPPPQDDQGLSEDELTTRASEVSSSDSKQADFLNQRTPKHHNGTLRNKHYIDFYDVKSNL